jgi:hypothetical protein
MSMAVSVALSKWESVAMYYQIQLELELAVYLLFV